MDDEIRAKRALGQGRWDKKLRQGMVALSKADNYDEAKHEWIATGEVWWDGVGARPEWAKGHPDQCLCTHNIVYHFEIHNTETDVRECVGSDHINSYLILRAIKEESGLTEDQITDEMIDEWITVRVEALKKTAWWKVNGEQFNKMFNEVKDLDLRVNVRTNGSYYDSTYRMMRPKTFIRKRSEGDFGLPRYKMASIVWRWNHPDNSNAQINKKGYPNEKLWTDLLLFYYNVEQATETIKKEDENLAERLVSIEKKDKEEADKRLARMKRREKIVAEIQDIQHEPAFIESCEYYGVETFVPEQGKDSWEERFLTDIKRKMISGNLLTDKQVAKLLQVVNNENKDVSAATDKQKNMLIRLGYDGNLDEINKSDASDEISNLIKARRNSV